MNELNHILFLVPGFPKDESDSTCLPYLQNYFRSLKTIIGEDHIHILTFQYPYDRVYYRWEGIEVFSAGGNNRGHLYRLVTWWRIVKQALFVMRTSDVQFIHSFWIGEGSLIGYVLSRMFSLPQAATIMGQDAKKQTLVHYFIDFSQIHLTCVSPIAAKLFERTFNVQRNISVIPWGIDQEKIVNQNDGPVRPIDILGVGSLTSLKKYDLFLDVIIELKKELTQLKVILIGDGAEYDQLLQKIQRSDIAHIVELRGSLPHQEVLEYMRKSKILLHTSSYESQGYVFMEALQCGMYTVSFEVGYIPPSAKSFIVQSKEEMVSTLSKLLPSQLNFDSIPLKSMEETAVDYLNIYTEDVA